MTINEILFLYGAMLGGFNLAVLCFGLRSFVGGFAYRLSHYKIA